MRTRERTGDVGWLRGSAVVAAAIGAIASSFPIGEATSRTSLVEFPSVVSFALLAVVSAPLIGQRTWFRLPCDLVAVWIALHSAFYAWFAGNYKADPFANLIVLASALAIVAFSSILNVAASAVRRLRRR